MTVVQVTQRQVDAAIEEIGKIIDIGERGTRADYTEIGALHYVLEALGVRLAVDRQEEATHAE